MTPGLVTPLNSWNIFETRLVAVTRNYSLDASQPKGPYYTGFISMFNYLFFNKGSNELECFYIRAGNI